MSRLSCISMNGASLRKKQRPDRKFRCLRIEQLESRQMLASQILGTVWNDASGDGVQQANETGLQGWQVFLDLDNSGTHDEHVQTFNSVGPPVPITDLTTSTSKLNVSGLTSSVVDVNVTLTINHTFDGDLDVLLVSPTGTRVELFSDVGGSGDGFANTTLDDQASISIPTAAAPFTGSFKPEGALSAFNGEDANGDWTLEIFDDANQDVGQLVSWSLTIRGVGEPMTTTDSSGVYAFTQLDAGDYTVRQVLQADWTQTLPVANAGHTVTLTQDQVLQNIDFGNKSGLGEIRGTVWNDVDGDGVTQAGEPELSDWSVYLDLNNNGSPDSEMQTVNSSGVPVAIADLTTVTSQIDVGGFATAIADLDLTLSLTHTYDADLDIFLISPTGTRVQLMTDVGGSGDNFSNTTLDDEAAAAITSGSAPFSGSFRPEGSLSDFDGEIANGIWTLEITDDANGDTGQLLTWSLTLVGEGEPQLVTDTSGEYAFVGLAPGDYVVRQVPQQEWSQTFPVNNGAQQVTVAQGDVLQNVNFGNRSQLGEIQGKLWNDIDGDGVQNGVESALADRTVFVDSNDNGTRDSQIQSFNSINVPVATADLTTVTSQMNVSGFNSPLADVDVTLSIAHTYNADLDVFLVSPTGTRVELFTDVGGDTNGMTNTSLDDEATTLITAGSFPFTGSFRPEGSLSLFDGEDANGIWRLEVTDDANQDSGQTTGWSLKLTGEGEAATVTNATGQYSFAGLSPGNYKIRQILPAGWAQTLPAADAAQVVSLASGQTATGVNFGSRSTFASISGTVWRDDNADGIPQAIESPLPDWTVYLDLNNNGVLDLANLTINSSDVPLQFVDSTTVTSTLDVAGFTSPIDDVNVTLSLSHTYNADLDVFLVSPTGTRVELFTDVGGDTDGFTNTTLDDEAASSITTAGVPFTGTFRPEGQLSSFDGQVANGTWTLEITDDADQDTGQLQSWSINISASGEPVQTTDVNGDYVFSDIAADTYQVRQVVPTDWAQIVPLNGGGHSVVLAEGQQATGLDFGNQFQQNEIRGTVWNDLNADGIRDAGENGLGNRQIYIDEIPNGQLDQERVTAASGHIDMPILDQSTVTSGVVVSGFGSLITDVNVALQITHTYDADLDVFIISPSGTRVELFTDVGGDGDNFTDTILDDQTDFPITTGLPPFVWSFQPEGILADFNGEDANGTWTLEITDDAGGDVGELHDWSIQITGASEPVLFTESDGSYAFSSLAPGNYRIRQILPPLWDETKPTVGFYDVQVQTGSLIQGLDFASYNTQPTYQLLPDLTVLADQSKGYLYDAVFETNGGQTLIRFTTATANIGEGVAQLVGGNTYPDGTQDVLQRIYDTDGLFTDRLAGQFVFHPEHNHIHFEGYAQYNLRAVTAGEGVGNILASAEKVSFCLLDSAPYNLSLPGAPSSAQFTSCGSVTQGVSVGWTDVYGDHLPDQSIDITGLTSGTYWLENVVDPENVILELDETNNTTRILIDVNVEAGTVTPVNPPQLLQAAGGVGLGAANVAPLDTASLEPLMAEAIAQFAAAGASASQLNTLASINFQIVDLSDGQLGRAFGSTIQLDVDGAGYGWFVDSTPSDNSEFQAVSSTELRAERDGNAYGSMDLLTVILHEFGHILDLDHDAEDGLMGESLESGTRHLTALDLFFSGLGER